MIQLQQIVKILFPFYFKWYRVFIVNSKFDFNNYKNGIYKIGLKQYNLSRCQDGLKIEIIKTANLFFKDKLDVKVEAINNETENYINVEFKADLFSRIFYTVFCVFFIVFIVYSGYFLNTNFLSKLVIILIALILLFLIGFVFRVRSKIITQSVIEDFKILFK